MKARTHIRAAGPTLPLPPPKLRARLRFVRAT